MWEFYKLYFIILLINSSIQSDVEGAGGRTGTGVGGIKEGGAGGGVGGDETGGGSGKSKTKEFLEEKPEVCIFYIK